MRDLSVLDIDLAGVRHNLDVIRDILGDGCGLCPILKADAYGLGAPAIAACCAGAGVELVAVFSGQGAAELCRAGVELPVLVLMPLRDLGGEPALETALRAGRLHLSLHGAAHLDDLVRLAETHDTVVPVHLEVDTGMQRGGCPPRVARALLTRIAETPRLRLAGVMTHYSSARGDVLRTEVQTALFEQWLEEAGELIDPACVIHAANTFATLRGPRYHQTMVRVGLAWAGHGPEWLAAGEVVPGAERLRPVLAWRSRVVHAKWVEAGATVGYGATWTAPRPTLVGLVPVGYADGVPVELGATDRRPEMGRVRVGISPADGRYAPIIGAVNMDQITIDLTDLAPAEDPPGTERAMLDVPVELLSARRGTAPNTLPAWAALTGRTPHELLCRLGAHLSRCYHPAPGSDHRAAAEIEVLPAEALQAKQ